MVDAAKEEDTLEAALSTEVTMTALDALEVLVRVLSTPGSDHLFFVLPNVFKALVDKVS